MADDKKSNSKKALDSAGEKVKGAFTGEDGSVFWACKEIYNACKVGLHALNMYLSRTGRAIAEIQEKSLNNTGQPAENESTVESAADGAFWGAFDGASDARDVQERERRQASEIDGIDRRDRFGDPTDLQ